MGRGKVEDGLRGTTAAAEGKGEEALGVVDVRVAERFLRCTGKNGEIRD